MPKCFDVVNSSSAGRLDLNELLVPHPASTFFMHAEGDAMQGEGISDGDILVVDRSVKPKRDGIVVAVCDGELTVKRLDAKQNSRTMELWGTVTSVIKRL